MIGRITLKVNFSRRIEEIGVITRKEYLLHYLNEAKNLVLSGETHECVIIGFFYPNDILVIDHFMNENPDITIGHSYPNHKGGHCTISIVKANQ